MHEPEPEPAPERERTGRGTSLVREATQQALRPPRPSLAGSPTRYAATLITALIATAPAFGSVMNDRLSLPEALLRFLIAFAAIWVLGALFSFVARVPGSAGADR